MKKGISLLLTLLAHTLVITLTACSSTERVVPETGSGREESETPAGTTNDSQDNNAAGNSNILIAYFSMPEAVDTSGVDAVASASIVVKDNEVMGNTEYVAKLIQQNIGGDLFRIETKEQYPLDHDPLVDQAAQEQDANLRPELATQIENFDQYETVILGFPNWWADLPMPVYSFLEEYDFGAKTIIPFVTHGGSRFSQTVETISQLQPGALMSDNGLSISRNDVVDCEDDVIAWAEGLGLNITERLPEINSGAVKMVDSGF